VKHTAEIIESRARYLRMRRFFNVFWLVCTGLCAFALILPLFGILGYLVAKGISSINLAFFTHLPAPVGEKGGGVANAIIGSVIVIAMAAVAAVPVGIMAAVYISEFRRGSKMASAIRFVCDMLNATPSIILGIFAYSIIVLPLRHFSALAGSFALFVMMTPVIVRGTEEILRTVPNNIREASLAIGASQWQTIWKIVLPAARRGITTTASLALARIGGETAPLLFTALGNDFWNLNPLEPTNTLPVQIYKFASSSYPDWNRQAWAAALLLVVLIMITNVVARIATSGSFRRVKR
jgi:phosphate transport system permease protein